MVAAQRNGPALRGLIVDDDEAIRQLLEDLLLDMGIDTQIAEDGREAETWLKSTDFDLLFLDVNLPHVRGDLLLELIRQGVLKRPGAIVMMSSDEALRAAPPEHWIRRGVLGFLAKPFAREQVSAFIEAARAKREQPEEREPGILIAGSGLWADALTRVVYRGGGKLVEARGPAEVLEVIRREHPAVCVFGPPIPDQELLTVLGGVRSAPEMASLAVFIGVARADGRLQEELQALGATGICVLPSGLAKLSTDVISAAGLNTRSYRRAPLAAPVWIQTSGMIIDAFARDLSEGGLGLVQVRSKPPIENLRIEFALPGDPAPVRAATQLAWTRPDGDTFRVGERFTALDETDRSRIRRYVEARGQALP